MAKCEQVVVENVTRGVPLVAAGRVADGYWTTLRGLIGHKPLQPGEGLLIVPCKSVHTQFMGFAIDVLYVSKAQEVVGMNVNMRPWRFGRYHKEAHWVLELPEGTLESSATQVGDLLQVTGYSFR